MGDAILRDDAAVVVRGCIPTQDNRRSRNSLDGDVDGRRRGRWQAEEGRGSGRVIGITRLIVRAYGEKHSVASMQPRDTRFGVQLVLPPGDG